MSKRALLLINLSAIILAANGCSVDPPLALGDACGGDEGVSAIHLNNSIITADTLDCSKLSDSDCEMYEAVFEQGRCPLNYECTQESDIYVCAPKSCEPGYHSYNGACEENSIKNCGQHGFVCAVEIAGWLDGGCSGAGKCVISECQEGYTRQTDNSCSLNTDCGENGHIYGSSCEDDTVENCGNHGFSCASTGMTEGECIAHVCVPTECDSKNYWLDEDEQKCVKNDNDNCGAAGNKCDTNYVCSEGECKDNCGTGTIMCHPEDGSPVCVVPDNDDIYCGANETCTAYTTCTNGKSCQNGQCVQSTCDAEDEKVCDINGERQCVDVQNGNLNHCGSCETSCEAKVSASNKEIPVSCEKGVCLFTCDDSYKNCGSSDAPECILVEDFQKNANHCGDCGIVCDISKNEFCSEGKCIYSKCTDQCLSNGECINQDDHCGLQCENCNTANNASSGQCVDGVCEILACATDYHLVSGTCVKDDETACGPEGFDCRTLDGWNTGSCKNSNCEAKTCQDDYHVNNNDVCIPDSIEECGPAKINCIAQEGWSTGYCEKATCIAEHCALGFCLNGTKCVNGKTQTSMCGTSGDVCMGCGKNEMCDDGVCTLSKCEANICFYNSTSCSNEDDHCGTSCIDCNTANFAASGTCDKTNGVCTITSCQPGYHLNSSKACESDSKTACGPKAVDCTQTVTGWKTGSCENGNCKIDTCETGYHLDSAKNVCILDDIEACGTDAVNCKKTVAGWESGSCTGGKCIVSSCTVGYHFNAKTLTCEQDTKIACGSSIKDCTTTIAGWKDGNCTDGQCVPTVCDTTMHVNSTKNTCDNDTTSACGSTSNDCSKTVSAWSTGSCTNKTCVVSTCQSGYHPKSDKTACESNTKTDCGTSHKNCTTSIANWTEGTCTASGSCSVTACASGYHPNSAKSACEANTESDCGASHTKCSTAVSNWSTGTCTADGTCSVSTCASGNHPNAAKTACETNTKSDCGTSHTDCSKTVANWSEGTCTAAGACSVTACSGDNHPNAAKTACEANSKTDCGTSHKNCTTSVANWSDGTCTSGSCVVSACKEGTHPNAAKTACETNTKSDCGASHTKCADTVAHWSDGTCTAAGVCAVAVCSGDYHPNSAKTACEANSATNCGSSHTDCTTSIANWAAGECTTAGACSVTSCKNDSHPNAAKTACEANSTTDCGTSHKNCTTSITNWSTGTCTSGVCAVTTCASGYHPNAAKTACEANTQTDCGTSHKNCTTSISYWSSGTCTTAGVCSVSACSGDYHPNSAKTACEVNSTTDCGSSHKNCTTSVSNWSTGTCTSGACTVSTCASGYHPNSAKTTCEANTKTDCGTSHTNCTTSISNWSDGTCTTAGKCSVSACSGNYHPNSAKTACEANTTTDCGTSHKDCTAISNWYSGTCTSGACSVSACQTNYHPNAAKTACEANSATDCGTSHKNCTTSISNWSTGTCTTAGACSVTSCASGYHPNSAKTACEANTATDCGSLHKNCTTSITNWSTGTCTSSGICSVSTCASNYHPNSGKTACEANSISDCGASHRNCITTFPYWSTGTCTSSGTCSVSTCTSGTHPNAAKTACETNSITDCGTAHTNCTTSITNWAGGTCTTSGSCSVTSCASGYHPNSSKTACEKDQYTDCGSSHTNCTNTISNSVTGACNAGACSVSLCKLGYHIYNNTCEANSNTNCGEHNKTCSSSTDSRVACNANGVCGVICPTGYTKVSYNGSDICAYNISSASVADTVKSAINKGEVYPGAAAKYPNVDNAYILTADIAFGTISSWTGVGTSTNPFTGKFFGNGHTFTGSLTCATGSCGIFGTAKGAYFENVTSSANVYGNASGQTNVGGLVGSATTTTIKKCIFSGKVTGTALIGGIAGQLTGSIEGSSSSGTVQGISNIGGFVGLTTELSITNSFSTSAVTSKGTNAGGLVGTNPGGMLKISNSYAKGAISGTSYVGGLVGNHYSGSIENAYATGNVEAVDSSGIAGGLVGMTAAPITLSYAIGDVVSKSGTAGGLVGQTSSNITQSGAFGNVTGRTVGGLFGSLKSTSAANIHMCFATGNVIGGELVAPLGNVDASSKGIGIVDNYTTGKIIDSQGSDAFINLPVSSSYLDLNYTWTGAKETAEKNSKNIPTFVYSSNVAYYNGKGLAETLSSNGSYKWKTMTCTLPTGPGTGSTNGFKIPIPASLSPIRCY